MNQQGMSNLLPRLQRWYLSQCDGEWEHSCGVRIGTLDNPGWSIEANLASTRLENRTYTRIDRGLDLPDPNADWFTCYVENQRFKGFGGPEKLAEMITIFLDWAESP